MSTLTLDALRAVLHVLETPSAEKPMRIMYNASALSIRYPRSKRRRIRRKWARRPENRRPCVFVVDAPGSPYRLIIAHPSLRSHIEQHGPFAVPGAQTLQTV